jgi:putative endonuclease
MKRACVYILASKRNGTLYVGVTNDISRRGWEHKSDVAESFTKEYGVHRLVYTEFHETMPDAILREKQIKKWRRAWKLDLIERENPQWRDLYEDVMRCSAGSSPDAQYHRHSRESGDPGAVSPHVERDIESCNPGPASAGVTKER